MARLKNKRCCKHFIDEGNFCRHDKQHCFLFGYEKKDLVCIDFEE